MSSRALAVKQALRAKLTALPEMADVEVSYGHPTRAPGRRWIALAEIQWNTDDWSTNRTREEEFSVTVVFDVQQKGGTSEEAEVQAFALASLFEDVLTSDPAINGLCVTSGFRPLTLKTWPISDGYESQYEIEVTAKCRLLRQ